MQKILTFFAIRSLRMFLNLDGVVNTISVKMKRWEEIYK